jgi:hypothetical protein
MQLSKLRHAQTVDTACGHGVWTRRVDEMVLRDGGEIYGAKGGGKPNGLSGKEILKGCELKNGVFWVVTPCGSFKNRRFGGTWRLLHQGDKNR